MTQRAQDDSALRFGGVRRIYGDTALAGFRAAHVCIVGLGGVGSWTAEALARSGVGQITLIDGDDVCLTNVNRQILALDTTIGEPKVEAMAARIRGINPHCDVSAIDDFLTLKNLDELLPLPCDVVVDAIDRARTKAALIAWCGRRKVRVVTIGGAGGQTDPLQIRVTDLNRTEHDPLAAKVRGHLRLHHRFSRNPARRYSVECVHSWEQARYPHPDGRICTEKKKGVKRIDCESGFGASVAVTAAFGLVAAARVLDRLARKSEAPGEASAG